ncbi:MAG TPA: methyltransferase [Candidatus Eisenbacteria bacterium]|nr:methyltransferase [Candidatus Eisenbacteria bacterium]
MRPSPSSAGLGPPHAVPAPEEPAYGRFRSILFAYQQAATLMAGYSLGLFREIHRRPQSADDVARSCATDPHGTRALLEALVAIGALQRHGPTYVLSRDLAPYLVPGLEGDATGQIDWAADLYDVWGDLGRAVQDGTPRYPLTGDAILQGDPSRVRRYIRAVHTGSREAAIRVAQMAPLLPGSSLLDVGGGSGIYAATYARQTPDLKAHLFDLAPTLDVARDILHAEGLEEQMEFHAGDFRHDPFPGPVDTVLLSNVIQTESEEHVVGILRRAFNALRPGGTLLVHGVMPDAALPPDAPVALFSLQMFLLFGHGRAWSSDQVCEWLAQEQFGVRFVKPIGEPFHTKLILATRIE